jgi:tRNA1(Val) A37 N6-methylase TrmN6
MDNSRLSEDTLYQGDLVCCQYVDGYRFSVDAILAAHFCPISGAARILDLGCGSGIIGLLLSYLHPSIKIAGLEIQPELVSLARENVCRNHLENRVVIHQGDACGIRDLLEAESFDLVVSNPPYRKCGSGRLNQAKQAAIARHELKADLADMLAAAAYSVKNRGTVVLVYPAVRFAHLAAELAEKKLALKRMQPVYSYPQDTRARLVLVEAVKNGGEECFILPPFYIYSEKDGAYSHEMQKMYEPVG